MYEKDSDVLLQEMRAQVAPKSKTRRKRENTYSLREVYQPVLERLAEGANEEWRDVTGLEGILMVSTQGRVARLIGHFDTKRYVNIAIPAREFSPHPLARNAKANRYGYRVGVHRIVAHTFFGLSPNPDDEVNHIDGDPSNNQLTNLEWCTHQENMQHAVETGQRTYDLRTATDEMYLKAKQMYATGDWSYKQIARLMGIGVGHVEYLIKSKRGRSV